MRPFRCDVLIVHWICYPSKFNSNTDVRRKLDANADLVETHPTAYLANTADGRRKCVSVLAFLGTPLPLQRRPMMRADKCHDGVGDLKLKLGALKEEDLEIERSELDSRSWAVRSEGDEVLRIQVRARVVLCTRLER